MTADDLRQLAAQLESDVLEFKEGRSSPEVISREISAFANTRGGTLLVGVGDSGSLVGVPDLSRARRDVALAAKSVTPAAPVSFEEVIVGGKAVIVVRVSKGAAPPHATAGQTFQRIGPRTVPMGSASAPDLRGSAYTSVLGGASAIAQGVGAVAAGERGIVVCPSAGARVPVGENNLPGDQPLTREVPYNTAFERVAGSTAFILDQLELSYRQTREQSNGWYRLSAIAAVVGSLPILGGVVAVFAGYLTAGVLVSVSGLIPEAAAALFFVQGKEANGRVDAIQRKLGDARELLTAVEIANTISEESVRNQMKVSIVLKSLGLDNVSTVRALDTDSRGQA